VVFGDDIKAVVPVLAFENRSHGPSEWLMAVYRFTELFLDVGLWHPVLRLVLPSKVPAVLESMLVTARTLESSVTVLVAAPVAVPLSERSWCL
jgi:hypothetical protein